MTLSLTEIPDDIACNATITFVPDTAKNTSEGGVSGRKLMRPILRNYIITVSPDFAEEMQAIVMATRGTRYPMALRDPIANEITENEALLAADGITAKIQRVWTPSTGSLWVASRILLPRTATVTVTVNDVIKTTGLSLGDYGIITFSPALDPDDEVLVSCEYLTPVCCMDSPSAVAFMTGQYQFNDMRLEEIFEAELVKLTA